MRINSTGRFDANFYALTPLIRKGKDAMKHSGMVCHREHEGEVSMSRTSQAVTVQGESLEVGQPPQLGGDLA